MGSSRRRTLGSVGQHQQQLQPPALAAGEGADGRPLGVGVEQEPLHEPALLPRGLAVGAGHRLPHPLGEVEVDADLVVVPDADGGGRGRPAPRSATGGRRGCRAGWTCPPRWPRRCPAGRPGSRSRSRPRNSHGLVAEAVADAVQVDHLVAQAGRGPAAQVEVDRRRPATGPRPSTMAVADVIRALGLRVRAGAPRRSQASSERARLRRTASAAASRSSRSAAGGQVAGVAVVVDVAPAPVELEDAGGDPVEDVAVVGDQDQPAAEAGQAVLQPGDGVDVEVVGGLVEDEQVDLLQQGPGQGHPLGLAAGEGGHVDVAHRAHPQPVEDGGRLPPLARPPP